MRLLLFAAAVELLLPISARSELPREIPFRYQDGLIWLKVELAGKKERLNFLLDSGASVSAVDLHTAHTCGVNLGDRRLVEGVSGQSFAYRVNDFQARAEGIALPKSVLAIDLGTVSERCQQHIDGILGADFFRDRIVQINFKAGKICVLENCEVNTANCDTLPIRMRNGAFCVPVRIAEKLRAVEKAIAELPQELKSPLILTALEDRSYAETAELLGISPKAVEMKVYRARKLLLGKLNELGF
jgi:Sigma-70, region 4/Aspartyl protease